jgi:large subunit ribosomal protein L19
MNVIEQIEKEQIRIDLPPIRVGDTLRVHTKLKEGTKERVQPFEGVVIRIKRGQARGTFTVRKVSHGVGVERIFPLHSPNILKIDILQRASVRRAKLYYLRERKGKAARLKEARFEKKS